jgi:hypothetical protein
MKSAFSGNIYSLKLNQAQLLNSDTTMSNSNYLLNKYDIRRRRLSLVAFIRRATKKRIHTILPAVPKLLSEGW